MALAFQDPGLLWFAAAAAAVPVAAHLVARTRPPEAILPTTAFLQRAMRRVWRLRRPQDWLMLILRTLALAILALGFARPLLLSGEGWSGGADEKHLVLVVDRSASMAGGAGAQSRFSLATARALEALRGAGRLSSVNLVWIDATPDAVYPGMLPSFGPVEQALREAEVTGEAGSGPVAIALAAERLAAVSGTRELIVVSDFQTGSWRDALPPLPESIRLVLIPVGEPSGNLSVATLESENSQPLPEESVEVLARIVNHGPQPHSARVAFTLGAQRVTREVDIEGRGEVQVSADFTLPTEGSGGGGEVALKVALEGSGDPLAADDIRWLILRPREPLAVALALPEGTVSAGEREVWSRLLRSIPWTHEVAPGDPAEVIVAAGPEEGFRSEAAAVLERRGGVFFRPSAAGAPPVAWGPEGTGVWERSGTSDEGWGLRVADENDPLLALFISGEYGNPAAGRSRDRWRLDPGKVGEWTVSLRYEDGVPAILRRSEGGGTLWCWNLPLDPERSSWTRQSAFLPLVGEALLLSRPGRSEPPHWYSYPGGFARWEAGVDFEGREVVLLDGADADRSIVEDSASAGQAWISAAPMGPGLYRWASRDRELRQDAVMAHTVVNFPESEMDDQAVDPATLAAQAEASGQASASAKPDWAALRDGKALWPWFIGVALALFALEALLLMLRQPRWKRPSIS